MGGVRARCTHTPLDAPGVGAYLGGGGTTWAAGARLPGPLAAAESRFLEALKNEIERIR
jgi:phosphoesterase RecJ-like protein